MTELVETHEPGSVGWQEQRRSRIGGSEVAAVLGLSPWESPFSLWHRKQSITAPIDDSPVLEWGRRLEDAVLAKWAEVHQPAEVQVKTTWLADGWRLANPDAIATMPDGTRVVVEVKTARYDDNWDAGPPVYYQTQVQWYLDVLNLDTAYVVVLISGSDYREFVVTRDRDDVTFMADQCRAFLDSIESGQRPDIDAADATYQTVRELHPDIDGTRHELPTELADALLDARRTHDAAKTAWQLHQSLVLDHMGDAQHADHPEGHRVAYRTSRKTAAGTPGAPFLTIDRKALKS